VKVLIVEDEKKIASLLRKGLEAQGFVVEVSHHGDEGFTLATTRPYDAAVLDIMLPGRDGLSILRNLRERKNPLPVILLTARSELNERLEGLNLGADDYAASAIASPPTHETAVVPAQDHPVFRGNFRSDAAGVRGRGVAAGQPSEARERGHGNPLAGCAPSGLNCHGRELSAS